MSKNRILYGIGNIHGDADILLQDMFRIYINDENEDDNKGFTFGSSLGAYIQNIL